MPPLLKTLVKALALPAAALLLTAVAATPASAGRYCTGSCDGHVTAPQIVVDRMQPLYTKRVVRRSRHVRRSHKVRRPHKVRRSHPRRHVGRIPRLAPQYGPVHMRGRTRFCSDHVVRRGHKLVRDCVQVRNDLLH